MAVEVNPTLQSAHADTQQAKAKYLTSLAHLIPDIKAQYSDTNYIFLSFITNYLPVGLVGLMIGVIRGGIANRSSI